MIHHIFTYTPHGSSSPSKYNGWTAEQQHEILHTCSCSYTCPILYCELLLYYLILRSLSQLVNHFNFRLNAPYPRTGKIAQRNVCGIKGWGKSAPDKILAQLVYKETLSSDLTAFWPIFQYINRKTLCPSTQARSRSLWFLEKPSEKEKLIRFV